LLFLLLITNSIHLTRIMSTLLPHPHAFVTSLISQLAAINSSSPDPVPSLSSLRRQDLKFAKSIFTTLHFLFPHELLPALDILDRKLVTQLRLVTSNVTDQEAVESRPLEQTAPTTDTEPTIWEIFYVQSASATASSSKSKSRYRRVYNPAGTYYEVRLDAWNCSCPAFAYSALGGALDLDLDQTRSEDEDDHTGSEMEGDEKEWRFGGTLTRKGTGAPICKHILAATLGKGLPGLFGNAVEKKEVTAAEVAGWGAGWGD
jgi:hypothetical protein